MCVVVQLEGARSLSHLVVSTNLFQHQDLIECLKKGGGGGSPAFGQMIISEGRTRTFSRLNGKSALRPSPKNLNLKF